MCNYNTTIQFLENEQGKILILPYILESNPHPNLICTSFCRFLKKKKKKKSVRGSNPHLSFNRPLPTRQTDSVTSYDGESDE